MTANLILKASSIITMEPEQPRAQAVAVDTSTGEIVAVGTLAECQAAAPGVTVTDLGDTVLMPGFIEAHSHPIVAGTYTEEPAHWISGSQGFATFADVEELWKKLDKTLPAGQPVLCWGLDRANQGAPELTNIELDKFFPTRPAVILDISGHEAYFNSATIALNGWKDNCPPADPPAARFGRNPDGTSNGRAYETGAVLAASSKVQALAIPDPLMSAARWYRTLAQAGITTSAENSYSTALLPAYEALASVDDTPLRIGVYHVATDPKCGLPLESKVPATRLWKNGIKMWADGTTFIGTLAASFAYLDNETTKDAQIALGPGGETMMNYTRAQFDEILDKYAATGLQFAIHAHGDVAVDIVLDAYAAALHRHNLVGTDHRWRVEHWSAGRADQFKSSVALGVATPMAAYQFIQVGDLLDGTLFPSDIGSQWIAAGDAIKAGATVSFHSDSPVAPAIPLLDVQCLVTRQTPSGELHGPNQAITVDDALKGHTINAAFHMRREHDLGSIKVGKLADFVELSADPYVAEISTLAEQVKVLGTWSSGRKIDLEAFITQVEAIDPTEHKDLAAQAAKSKCC